MPSMQRHGKIWHITVGVLQWDGQTVVDTSQAALTKTGFFVLPGCLERSLDR